MEETKRKTREALLDKIDVPIFKRVMANRERRLDYFRANNGKDVEIRSRQCIFISLR